MTNPSSEVSGRRRAFVAAFLGWMLDGYDFTLLTLVLIDIQREFGIDHAAAGALGTATLVMRLVGGAAAGAAADRWGRKTPLLVSIAWFSLFSFLSGLSPTYGLLLLCRALFGLGMGGEWAAAMPLVMEHFPEHRRGAVLGVLQGAFSWGFVLAAAVFQYLGPVVEGLGTDTWRILLWTGILPALLVLWIRRAVPESPLWLAGQAQPSRPEGRRPFTSFVRLDVLKAAGALAAMMFAYQSMSFWYASLLRERNLAPLPYLIALNIGGIIGAAAWGRLADTRLGPRGAIALGAALSVAAVPLFLFSTSTAGLWFGAFSIGLTGAGVIGVSPTFVGRLFDTADRATGWGFVYHTAAAAGALAPYIIGSLQDTGWSLHVAMATGIAVASVLTIALVVTRAGSKDPAS